MNQILISLGLGLSLFISTNLDDLLVLLVFFADRSFNAAQVVAGQYLGVGALVGLSVGLASAARSIPASWIGLTGIFPLLIGLKKLLDLRRKDDGAEDANVKTSEKKLSGRAHSQMLTVAMVVCANCGDNIAVWVPVFTRSRRGSLPWFVLVFAVMTGVWCGAAYLCVNNKAFGHHIRRWGRVVLPFALIGLGVYVLSDAMPLLTGAG